MSDLKAIPPSDNFKGWLYKWTNYLRGYQKRWFVLQNGLLSYYRNQSETSHTCRGTINLANALIHTGDSSNIVISNGGTRTFHLKAGSEVERQRWVTALELSKARAISIAESDDDMECVSGCPGSTVGPDKQELESVLRILNTKLTELRNCTDLISKHGAALQRVLCELEQADSQQEATSRLKAVNERASLFRVTSSAVISACTDYVELVQSQARRWQRLLTHEHEQRLRLEELVEQLGRQHSSLERQVRKSLSSVMNHSSLRVDQLQLVEEDGAVSDDEDFYDAMTEQTEEFKISLPSSDKKSHQRTFSDVSGVSVDGAMGVDPRENNYDSSESDSDRTSVEARVISHRRDKTLSKQSSFSYNEQAVDVDQKVVPYRGLPVTLNNTGSARSRRTSIPDRPNYSLNLWSIMKNCIGRDLSKIPMPVNFSEPLSFLQRLTEDFEYSECLDAAVSAPDTIEQMAYVAAFTVSSYANTTTRTMKPFNPLLGETFECDRLSDLGWRSLAEQVSHHPPVVAMFTESKSWSSWQEFTMSSKFRGKYLQIIPLGIAHLLFTKDSSHYTWRKVTTTVHNIIVGKLWVDNHGEMDIVNHKTGDVCHLKYTPYSYFTNDVPRKVTGVIKDASGTVRYVLSGAWDEKMEGSRVLKVSETNKGKVVYETGDSKVLWQRRFPPSELERCYHFTQLAVELNEPEEGVAPTDSRNRPDQRQMELGNWDDANRIKMQLEEKQRAASRQMEEEKILNASKGEPCVGYSPKWFVKEEDISQVGGLIHHFTGEYWQCKEKQDWSRCPDIYI